LLATSFNALDAQSRKQKGLIKLAKQEFNQLRFAYAIPVIKKYLLTQSQSFLLEYFLLQFSFYKNINNKTI
jgi:hypothetical protein